ncbi:sugar 3,4-ketoisomerase [Paraclostridium bifermentans]|uniref:sugar 3,4-ketoisomerase n=1 Tax=Paraclostridium bifermentans TaxID=1490 RepID=UPI001C7FEE2D|nr:FdtA/QdtA family cupin domain-containing protein [Paraclostridium bifermentans]GIM33810.1 dTDP-6-deoxy-3,4-keto-hexulose isomerase [Paraclostridium bifermentans subsp. muricolitidis]
MKLTYKFKLNSNVRKDGTLVPLEFKTNIPFEVKRIFYIHNVENGKKRGCHAYYKTHQILICIAGNLKVRCFDGLVEKVYNLNNLNEALYISPKIWRSTFEHSKDAVLLVLSSLEYNESDYIRKYEQFLEAIRCT